ncbi:MAG: hypothetical protein GW906_06325 [Epsilonproteobacteria bacterium]|nr:hypothetical protein [Campylobacterota bacterium]OIO17812.1 MAG: hypothetical protein AUJ81_01050 [Helicobacteraceae bacterium CG1_02_36_14]PIP10510.1 MAG: hypothetical protein COX50_05280 [Sulfurimonas sp. CG23_combo_of_CG06-09_8_20_14_all_36_33]PIS26960.1 MAG: hypothetical protein COT46_00555 [Sulfurimonas sp. CG08_land_8_20_14_0_20_36_33]PIU35854.1 MAG: hypothetical protein COT05_01530 [Sulfurimonas sp. CG07_land_8_20_14_0_80_36_56]PIV03431.1 MAG: hypothetical protein COS56_08385 [Sulfur
MDELILTAEMIKQYEDTQYIRDRKTAYSQLNQMELIFNDKVNGTNTWEEAILAIKAKYPKPTV